MSIYFSCLALQITVLYSTANDRTFTRLTCISSCFPHRLANKSTLPKNGVPYTKRIFKHFTIKNRHCIPRSNKSLQRMFFCEISVRRSKNCLEIFQIFRRKAKNFQTTVPFLYKFRRLSNKFPTIYDKCRLSAAQDGGWRVKRVESLTVQNLRVTQFYLFNYLI